MSDKATTEPDLATIVRNAYCAERTRCIQILRLCEEHKMPELAHKYIDDDTTFENAQLLVLARLDGIS